MTKALRSSADSATMTTMTKLYAEEIGKAS